MLVHVMTLLVLITISKGDDDDEKAEILAYDPKFRSDYIFYEILNGFLKYQEIPANFREARLRCHLEGATLASPLDDKLESALVDLMEEKNTSKGILTGIHASFSRGDFSSVEGVNLANISHTWVKNEPNNRLNQESCIKLSPITEMSDVSCEEPLPYVCYKKAGDFRQNECGTIDYEYKFDYRTGHCYKFHRLPRTWSRAYMTCAAEGGYLAIINSDTEGYVLKDLYAKNPGSVIIGQGDKDEANIGYHDWGEHGEFLTIEGETLKQAGYEKWGSQQPNNVTDGQFCGSIERTGLLNDIWCERLLAFICEKDPKTLTNYD